MRECRRGGRVRRWEREIRARDARKATTRAESILGDETYPPHTGLSHVIASATAKYANDTCAATRAAPSVDMVSAARTSEGFSSSKWICSYLTTLSRKASRLEKSELRRCQF